MDGRRTHPRRTPAATALARVTLPAPALPATAAVLDFSARGVRLYVAPQVAPGQAATLELLGLPPAARRPLGLRVVHARRTAGGGCVLGCRLDEPLTDAELAVLMRGR